MILIKLYGHVLNEENPQCNDTHDRDKEGNASICLEKNKGRWLGFLNICLIILP